jgi:hypothetical protein
MRRQYQRLLVHKQCQLHNPRPDLHFAGKRRNHRYMRRRSEWGVRREPFGRNQDQQRQR